MNVTREIDNFFPGTFDYLNIRVYDDEKTDLLKHWDNTFKYITKARKDGSKVLVHCKMGVSRSASVVIAYAMKAYDWDLQKALKHVKEKRNCIKPNNSFISQLETYQGILDAMKNKEKLQRSKSETNLKLPAHSQTKNGERISENELPPVIKTTATSSDEASGQDLREIGVRPKSWSPDISCNTTMDDAQTVFLSLENLNQRSASKDSLKSLRHKCLDKTAQNRNVLLPCDNGESYSVSPNQIRHLPGLHLDVHNEHTSVKDRVNELESSQKSMGGPKSKPEPDLKASDEVARGRENTETWDPGEKSPAESDVCDSEQASDKSAVVGGANKVPDTSCATKDKSKTLPRIGDPFSNQLDRVFEREERKQQRMSVPVLPSSDFVGDDLLRECPSRQNSWSSYDSAVVLGYQGEPREAPSRHSSWGSGDTRALPSRNSSWGSYDMRQSGSTGYVNEKLDKTDVESSASGMFPYDREDIPWYPGTVKRTKQKLEECAGKKTNETPELTPGDLFETKTKSSSSDTLTSDYPSSVASQNESIVETFNPILVKSHRDEDTRSTSSNVEIVPSAIRVKSNNKTISRLSVSAPESSSMDLIPKECSLSRSVYNVSTIGNDSGEAALQYTTVKKRKTFLESLGKIGASSKKSPLEEQNSNNICGIVRSRKKEFEAKTTPTNGDLLTDSNSKQSKNRVNSLPSSPTNIHVDKELKEEVSTSSDPGEDLKMRQLIGKFEDKSNPSDYHVNMRQKSNNTFFRKNARNSYTADASVEKKVCLTHNTPLIANFNKINPVVGANNCESGGGELKRPPIAPVVRNNTQANNLVVANVITKTNKKQQQYGKSHPLARLNIKPRHNNPVYNTM